jgi:hypothetical protein
VKTSAATKSVTLHTGLKVSVTACVGIAAEEANTGKIEVNTFEHSFRFPTRALRYARCGNHAGFVEVPFHDTGPASWLGTFRRWVGIDRNSELPGVPCKRGAEPVA